jgi:hypothetical protein
MTFMDGSYNPRQDGPDCIPAMQNGMGIISCLKYYAWSGGWQEDAHADKLHNFVDAMNAFPE